MVNETGKGGRINPFHPRSPATPDLFVGRSSEIERFCEYAYSSAKLKYPSPEHIAILGNWGMGKTSLLKEFGHTLDDRLKNQIKSSSLFCTIASKDGKNWDTFTTLLLREVQKAVLKDSRITAKMKAAFKEWNFGLSVGPIRLERIKREGIPDLAESLEELWSKYLKPSGFEICFVFLDDLHKFQFNEEDDLYDDIRNVFQDLVGRGCNYLLAITTLPEPFYKVAEFAEQYTRFFTYVTPEPFSIDETRTAIIKRLASTNQGINVEEKLINRIQDMTEGHPFVTMLLMSELFKNTSNEIITINDLERNIKPIMEGMLNNSSFQSMFKKASEKERDLLYSASRKGLRILSAKDFKGMNGVSSLFSGLVDKELLVKKDRGKYVPFHPLFLECLKYRRR